MKKLITIILPIILFISCEVDIRDSVITSKSQVKSYKNGEHRCHYETKIEGSLDIYRFYAPCDCYNVGDSTNKYLRFYEKAHK